MSTNHNRIKVADLETNQPNKILKTNQNGELEFSDVENQQGNTKYKIFTAILNQTGTNPPVARVLENTLGDISFSYLARGTYIATLNNGFPEGKTFTMASAANTNININNMYVGRIDDHTIRMICYSNSYTSDGINTMLQIKVYS
ncbi:hypothetical protein [Flavobacterium phragmitis]|uniref:Uncharacterized protein n=1 Tax=Flavobacterium phragmitis TaxID=739143 RepID=A0A1I1WM76_9FLAO|nr:hypothetical protein [Flavobacterium phragmitis]SFD94170.1 hypothetical protein SAMN05216297_11550 [Flavobacterium phragmitis]